MEEDRKNLENRIQRMEKMEALGTLAGGVAHDLNNILSGIVGYPDLILTELPDDSPLRESILAIKRSGQKAAAVVQDLLTLAKRGMVSMEVMNWKGSRVHLSKALMNLISNAAEAIPERGVVTISTRNQYLDRPIKGYDNVKEGELWASRSRIQGKEFLCRIGARFLSLFIQRRRREGAGRAWGWRSYGER